MQAIGPYRVERCLGAGTFAVVWLAVDDRTGRRYAIKVLGDNWNRHPDVRQRFYREARLLWHADSERIVDIETVGELETGQPYIVMEYAEGGTLKTRLTEQRVVERRLFPPEVGLGLVAELARCVAAVHDRDAVHRDLKPENVLIQRRVDGAGTPVESLVLGDFGLAKFIEHNSALSAAVGSPGYMPPEQWSGSGRIGKQADVYSLGAMAYEILASQPAFKPEVPVDERSIPTLEFVRTDLPPHVYSLLTLAMDPDPARRPSDAGVFLESLLNPAAIAPPAVAPHAGRGAGRPPRRRTAAIAAVVLSLLGTIGVTIATGFRSEAAIPPIDEALLLSNADLDEADQIVTPPSTTSLTDGSASSSADGPVAADGDEPPATPASTTSTLAAPVTTTLVLSETAPTSTSVAAKPQAESFGLWLSETVEVTVTEAGPPEWKGSAEDVGEVAKLIATELSARGIDHQVADGVVEVFFDDDTTGRFADRGDGVWSYVAS